MCYFVLLCDVCVTVGILYRSIIRDVDYEREIYYLSSCIVFLTCNYKPFIKKERMWNWTRPLYRFREIFGAIDRCAPRYIHFRLSARAHEQTNSSCDLPNEGWRLDMSARDAQGCPTTKDVKIERGCCIECMCWSIYAHFYASLFRI